MTLKELQPQLLALTPEEKSQAIQILVQSLSNMARLYADEQFPKIVVKLIRELGHDILTVQEAGKANQRVPDEDVVEKAIATCINISSTD